MTKSEMIKDFALEAVGCAYIYGATGQACTPEYRKARMEQYPQYAEQIRKACPALKGGSCEGCKYQGRKAYDCAQLTRYAAKAAGLTLPSGASSQWKKGDWSEKGAIDTLPVGQACFLYMEKAGSNPMGHTGIYLGDGTAVDARGHSYGVVHMPISGRSWTHWAILRGQDGAEIDPPPTLRKGSTGEAVKRAQGLLDGLGFDIGSTGADGVFGSKTLQAVKDFQQGVGLAADGVIGPATWAALEDISAMLEDPAEPESVPDEADTVPDEADTAPDDADTAPELTDAEKLAILWEWYLKKGGGG